MFKITTSGKESVIYNFGRDGEYPRAGLVEVNGTLYGTTEGYSPYEYGTVFSITP